MKQPITLIFISLFILTLVVGCGGTNKSFNVFPVSKDVELGSQVASSIDEQNKKQLLDSQSNVAIYKYIYSVRDSILQNNTLTHSKDFAWRIRIIANDSVLNAFCTPGGYIYFYTGILKYLESEDQLAGVMGHEMAHAEKRHSTDAMTRQYGVSILMDLAFGQGKGQLARIAGNIAELGYGRDAEKESDEFSVRWLYNTSYYAAGASGFFQKMENSGGGTRMPEFLSTHPNPANRIAEMKKLWQTLGGKPGKTYQERYAAFVKSLPKQ